MRYLSRLSLYFLWMGLVPALLLGDVQDAREYQKELQQKYQKIKDNFASLKDYYTPKYFDIYRAVKEPMKQGIELADEKMNELSYIPGSAIDILFTLSQDMLKQTQKGVKRVVGRALFSFPSKQDVINLYQDRFALLEVLLSTVAFATIVNVLNQYEQLETKDPRILKKVLVGQLSWLTKFIKQSDFASMFYAADKTPKEKLLKQLFSDLYSQFDAFLKQEKDLPTQEALVNTLLPQVK